MFNSQKINTDIVPWEIYDADGDFTGDRTCTPSSIHALETVEYAPRPRYDNNPNPILVAFRESAHRNARSWIYLVESDLIEPIEGGHERVYLDHARKVLTKLIGVYGE